jgi:hypothetical protein
MAHHGTVVVLPSRRTQVPIVSNIIDGCGQIGNLRNMIKVLGGGTFSTGKERFHHERRRIGRVCIRPCCLRLLRWFGAMGTSVVIV